MMVQAGSPSLSTQSTPLTVTHLSVVGPGTVTPQRRITKEGSPHAAVAWLLVVRRVASAKESGRATIMGAQAGLLASLASSMVTVGAQAVSSRREKLARGTAKPGRGTNNRIEPA